MRNGATIRDTNTSITDAISPYPIELPDNPRPRSSSAKGIIEYRNVPNVHSDAKTQKRVFDGGPSEEIPTVAFGDVYGLGSELLMGSVCQHGYIRQFDRQTVF